MKQVGVYINTFDPINNSDIVFANLALDSSELDLIYFLAEPLPKSEQGVKSLMHRMNMIQLALANYKGLGTIMVKGELTVSDIKKSITMIKERFNNFTFIVLESELGKLIRYNWFSDFGSDINLLVGVTNNSHDAQDKVAAIGRANGKKINASYFQFSIHDIVNRTHIKRELKLRIKPASLPSSVYGYIKTHGLYMPKPEKRNET